MLSKTDHVAHWKLQASRDWESVHVLSEAGKYVHALFFAHLVLEKLLKAHWVKDNMENIPPKSHNLNFLMEQTNLEASIQTLELLESINLFNIEGRYQDYKDLLFKQADKKYTKEKIHNIDTIRKWLIQELP